MISGATADKCRHFVDMGGLFSPECTRSAILTSSMISSPKATGCRYAKPCPVASGSIRLFLFGAET